MTEWPDNVELAIFDYQKNHRAVDCPVEECITMKSLQ